MALIGSLSTAAHFFVDGVACPSPFRMPGTKATGIHRIHQEVCGADWWPLFAEQRSSEGERNFSPGDAFAAKRQGVAGHGSQRS